MYPLPHVRHVRLTQTTEEATDVRKMATEPITEIPIEMPTEAEIRTETAIEDQTIATITVITAETTIETITEASEMTQDVLLRVAEALTEIMTEAEAMTEITIEQAAEVMTETASEKKPLQWQLPMM